MVTEADLSRLARSFCRCVPAVAVAAAMTACTPRTTSDRACPIGNLALTALKDPDHFDRYHDGIDAPMAELFRQASPRSCALVVVAQNRIATINHYGVPLDLSNENLDADAIADAAERVIRARLYVGSISKTVTALAAMKLNEEAVTGGITTGPPVALIDRPLVELFPPVSEVPDWADFTIKDYLAHKSGAPHDPDIDDSALDGLPAYLGPHPGIHPRWAFAVYKDTADPIQGFEPGDTARYSNTGYALVGAAIDWQTVSTPASAEVGYEKYVFKKIALADGKTTDPTMLSMCLGTPWRAPYMDNLAIGYDTDSTTPLAPQNFSGWEGPAGGWTMTIGDLGRLMIAMNTDKRISAGSLTTMLNFYSESELLGIDTKWGLGMWRSLEAGGRMVYGKGGNATGFTSDFVMYRGDGVGAAMVCNQHGVDHLNMRIALRTIMNACVGAGTKPVYCAPP